MSDYRYGRCNICNRIDWVATHQCPPRWEWRTDEYGEDEWMGPVYAKNAEQAAELAAEIYDMDDYPLSRGGETIMWVRALSDPLVHSKWTVAASMLPQYHAELHVDDAVDEEGNKP